MKRNVYVTLILVSVLLCARAAPAQTPATPLPPRHAGPLYKVPGQMYPIDPATGQIVLPPALQAQIDKRHQGDALAVKGTAAAAQEDWGQAVSDYQQALTLNPDSQAALYGLADYSVMKGYTQAALGYYRQTIYTHPDPPALPQFQEPNAYRLMEFALLLSQTGQQDEALKVYRHATQVLAVQMFNVYLKMPLPDFGDGPDQVPFTPQRLQAMADVGWAYDHEDFDRARAWTRLQQAVALYPDSPVPYFYRGYYEVRFGTDYKGAGADFDKAARLGDDAQAEGAQQEQEQFKYWIDAATQASSAPKATP